MFAKAYVIFVLVCILYCLGSAAYHLVRRDGDQSSTLKFLTWRIVLSMLLFASLFVGFSLGYIKPHGIV